MKLLIRTFSIIFFLTLLDLAFYSCRKPKEYKYKYTAAQFQLQEYDASSNSITRYLNTDGDTASFDKLQMYVHLRSEKLAFAAPAPGLIFNAAYAFSYSDHYINTSRLKRIDLKTLENFNDNHTAGSDIQNAVIFGIGNASASADTARGEKFIALYNNYPYYKEAYDKSAPEGVFWIKLTEKPTIKNPQQLAMEIELEDGTILRDTTIQFIVK